MTDAPASPPRTHPESRRRGGLFRRIYLSFVLTVVAFAALVGLAVLTLASPYDAAWVESVDAAVTAREPALTQQLADRPALERELAALADELQLRAVLVDPDGKRLAGDPATRGPRGPRGLKQRQRARLLRGQPMVHRDERGPALSFGLSDPDGQLVAVLSLDTGDGPAPRARLLALALLGLLAALAVGAWPLARSLTRRIAALELGAGRIARGELGHRVPGRPAGDELDRLGDAFNEMAARLEAMLRGQRALLTNVSHELRTPIARMRVLAELLGERVDALPNQDHPGVTRLRRGIAELGEDLLELETLISDLLTSGRLDLAGTKALQRSRVELAPLLTRLAARVDARARCEPQELHAELDLVLVERLLANLLHNARRACPQGQIDLSARVDADQLILSVEDEGPGIAPADRATIFDPFTRLDAARARDHGGVGLGLYLCRQIAQAHGGTITAEDRPGGAQGARLAVRLPLATT
ncbi:ATP-binding protein [Nannocystis sp.]|uniref:HAMP domain-containing sensor histidine kinase n=1 Tax=Nannocystis sp. TaxID=1962667 RepID=UPI0025CEDAB9|nr:ATP-binding protein [Nannocystis sp.]MBK7828273.1 HAMP domain-containing protein [Nannocystis sp.]